MDTHTQQRRQQQQHQNTPSSSDPNIASMLNRISSANQYHNHNHNQQGSMASSNVENFDGSAQSALFEGQYKGHLTSVDQRQQGRQQHSSGIPAISQGSWPAFEDIANALATDFDASLSGLGNFSHDQNFGTDNATSSEDAMNKPMMSPKDSIHSNESGSTSSNKRRIEAISTDQILAPSEIKQEKPYAGHDSSNSSEASGCDRNRGSSHVGENGRQTSSGESSTSPPHTSFNFTAGLEAMSSPNSSSNEGVPEMNVSIASYHHGQTMKDVIEQEKNEFQYILGAPTAVGSKLGEETMTYLNQSQAYEIRLRRLIRSPSTGLAPMMDLTGKMLRSVIRIGFQERRLQYYETEEMNKWRQSRPQDRMLKVDSSLSYGVFEVKMDPEQVHVVEFLWDPMREASVFVRINCISSEFTVKGHGGEKGAPLKLFIETYIENTPPIKLDTASCQIKVFKSKGADRKHKTDREKVGKLPADDQADYQPSYECTLLTRERESISSYLPQPGGIAIVTREPTREPIRKSSLNQQPSSSSQITNLDDSQQNLSPTDDDNYIGRGSPYSNAMPSSRALKTSRDNQSSPYHNKVVSFSNNPSPLASATSSSDQANSHPISSSTANQSMSPPHPDPGPGGGLEGLSPDGCGSVGHDYENQPLPAEASAAITAEWLEQNKFSKAADSLKNFTGKDVRRLTKEDLCQLCGPAEGIRLYNSLHTHYAQTSKTLYFSIDEGKTYHPIYLEITSVKELCTRLAEIFRIQTTDISAIHLIGPNGIRIQVNDRSIEKLQDEGSFKATFTKDSSSHQNVITITSGQT